MSNFKIFVLKKLIQKKFFIQTFIRELANDFLIRSIEEKFYPKSHSCF